MRAATFEPTRPDDYLTRLAAPDLGRASKSLAAAELAIRPVDVVLDLGCGPGADLALLAAAAGRSGPVIGVDHDPAALRQAKDPRKAFLPENRSYRRRHTRAALHHHRDSRKGDTGSMTLATAFTRLMGTQHPIALAPMGDVAGGALTAAVSNGGGLGLLGGGNGELDWLVRELPIVAQGTDRPWGVGFQSWAIDTSTLQRALEWRPPAVMLSFGDPRPFTELIRQAGARLIIQVTDLDEARQAVDLGADVIVAQGAESGGHSGGQGRSTLAFVPVVVDLAGPIPVLAAGGIADGRGIAAALCLGAVGSLVGTRFQATAETLADAGTVKAIIDGQGGDTERNRILDIARGSRWPSKYPARTLAHPFLDQWRDREEELAADPDARQAYQDGITRGELPSTPVWASQAIDLINDLPSAADLVGSLAAQAEEALARAANG